jgi:hemerythrin-like domain-containing protein
VRRSEALAPLSRDHHQALAAALRLRRADEESVTGAVEHFRQFFETHGRAHFALEEQHLLPALPATDADWSAATERVLVDHAAIRERAAGLASASVAQARGLGELLAAHVRFEERVLFAMVEERLSADELERLGRLLR